MTRGRGASLDRLASRAFDLLVIGGGIVGAATAAHAARAGLSVALVDKGDFGGATSATQARSSETITPSTWPRCSSK